MKYEVNYRMDKEFLNNPSQVDVRLWGMKIVSGVLNTIKHKNLKHNGIILHVEFEIE